MQERNALFKELMGLGLYSNGRQAEMAEAEVKVDPTDVRIDVRAKFSLQRMLKQGGAAAQDAEGMITAINTGQLSGIDGDNTMRAVQTARQLGTQRWLLVPTGKDAELVRVPTGSPSIVFRDGVEKNKDRFDMALRSAWWSYGQKTGSVPPVKRPLPIIKYGAKGWAVIFLQRRLNVHGANLVEDGIWGNKMTQSVLAFQYKRKLTADGIVGPLTWKKLNGEPKPKEFSNQTYRLASAQQTTINPFDSYVLGTISVLDQDIADILFGLHKFTNGTMAHQIAVFAHHELYNGNLVGMVRFSNSDKIKSRIAPIHHPRLIENSIRTDHAVTQSFIDVGHTRGYIFVNNGELDTASGEKLKPGNTRAFVSLVIAHELTHFRNRVKAIKMGAEPVNTANFDDVNLANGNSNSPWIRRGFIDELVCRHFAWYVKGEIDAANNIPVVPLLPGQLYRGAIERALDFGSYKLDPGNRYMEQLSQNKAVDNLPYLFRRQVAKWMKNMIEMDFHDDSSSNDVIKKAIENEFTFVEKTNFALPQILGRGFR